jgi:membrane protease YdiL (CAAX protease family)
MSEVAQPAPELEPTPPVEPQAPTVAPAPASSPPWLLADRWWGALGLVFAGTIAFFVGQIVPAVAVVVWLIAVRHHGVMPDPSVLETEVMDFIALFTLSSTVTAAGVIAGLLMLKQLAPGPKVRASILASALWAIGMAAVVLAGASALVWLQTSLGYPVEEQEALVKAFNGSTGAGYASLVAAIVVLAPLGEELFFRRFVLMTLRAGCGVVVANLLTAWLFALVHMNPPAFLNYCWLGLATAFAYQRTGRLWVPIAIHAANNLTAVLANAS